MTIKAHLSYLEKQRFAERQIMEPPKPDLQMILVIPCYDEPELKTTLDSLEACQPIEAGVEVIVVINSGEREGEEVRARNQQSLKEAQAWRELAPRKLRYHFLHFPDLPRKHAGVGLARKIGMDEAVDRFEQAENPKGIILCLDADSQVASNYLKTMWAHFQAHPKTEACSIAFLHPVKGDRYPSEVYEGIVQYELYLRFYVAALRYAGYPYAYHTIGSSMATRTDSYQKVGGMNRRKAGEDFYFLHKLIPGGRFSEVKDTWVIPSPRPGDRVPFGTGKAIKDWLDKGKGAWMAYAPANFTQLKAFLAEVDRLYEEEEVALPEQVQAFLAKENFADRLPEMRKHASQLSSFRKRFFSWFDGLKVLQFLHFGRDHYFPDIPVEDAAVWLLRETVDANWQGNDPEDLLNAYREWEGIKQL